MANQDKIYFNPVGSPVAPDRFDVRVRLQYLARGRVSLQELQKHLTDLPDDAANADIRPIDEILNDESVDTNGALPGTTH